MDTTYYLLGAILILVLFAIWWCNRKKESTRAFNVFKKALHRAEHFVEKNACVAVRAPALAIVKEVLTDKVLDQLVGRGCAYVEGRIMAEINKAKGRIPFADPLVKKAARAISRLVKKICEKEGKIAAHMLRKELLHEIRHMC